MKCRLFFLFFFIRIKNFFFFLYENKIFILWGGGLFVCLLFCFVLLMVLGMEPEASKHGKQVLYSLGPNVCF